MNTLSDRSHSAAETQDFRTFRYPLIPEAGGETSATLETQIAREQRMQQAQAIALAAARENAIREAKAQAVSELEKAIEQERKAIAAALEEFVAERARYFRRVETDVVNLALAIARKVLHREAQADALLLAGAVRVALDQVQAGTRVRLRTADQNVAGWRSLLTTSCHHDCEVEVVGDPALSGSTCLLEAGSGTAEISLDGQLREIERGFLDLLTANPGNPA